MIILHFCAILLLLKLRRIYMYKLIATDCDKTLIDSKGYLPDENRDVLRRLHNMGIHIIVATGRSDILAKDYLDELDIDCPVIGCNGASMCNFYTGENFFTKSMMSLSRAMIRFSSSLFRLLKREILRLVIMA